MFEGNIVSIDPKAKKHVTLLFHRGAEIPGNHPQLDGGGSSRSTSASLMPTLQLPDPVIGRLSSALSATRRPDPYVTRFTDSSRWDS
jgi:hypothetical protein